LIIQAREKIRRDIELSWEPEAAYDAKNRKMNMIRTRELSAEEAAKLNEEMKTPSALKSRVPDI
jgi:hypothetical protein